MSYKDEDKKRKYKREWRQNIRDEYLKDKSCSVCGSTHKLNIHHVNPEEKITHYVWTRTKEFREMELSKCIILCELCHQKLHNPKVFIHGTITMYKNHKCKCEKCRKANADYEHRRRIEHVLVEA